MAAATGLTLVKRFLYRGDPNEEFSNTYWFKPVAAPADHTAWFTLLNGVWLTEKKIYPSTVELIRAYGYDDDAGHKPGDTGTVAPAVFSVDFRVPPESPQPGELVVGTGVRSAGDDAVWCRWMTERRTSPGGKPIYLRKYFHPAFSEAAGGDAVLAAQKTNLQTHATKMSDGTLVGGRTVTTAGRLDTILGTGVSSFITTRTLKRRGRRP